MKARSREINIFNMSLLDVLCGALGAFCFMMLTLFPYYSKAHMSQPGAPLPVTISIMWLTEKHDVDIYLQHEGLGAQPEPTLDHKISSLVSGDSRSDWATGPGFETWMMRDSAQGAPAKLYFVLFNQNGNSAPAYVYGTILCSKYVMHLPAVRLDQQNRILHVADIARKDESNLDVIFTPEFKRLTGDSKVVTYSMEGKLL